MNTVLAVDDSQIIQEIITRSLINDYRVLVTDNAADALTLLLHESIDLLLLDVSLPGMDGFELCRTLRNMPQFHLLPIVMVTARNGAFDRVQGRLAGATEYLVKPFADKQLQQVVERCLSDAIAVTQ